MFIELITCKTHFISTHRHRFIRFNKKGYVTEVKNNPVKPNASGYKRKWRLIFLIANAIFMANYQVPYAKTVQNSLGEVV